MIAIMVLGLLAPVTAASSKGPAAPANTLEPFCGDPTTVSLLSDKNIDIGTVTVTNGETTLFVTYTVTPSWTLVKTDLAVANSLADIPVTNKGNPKVGQFPYHTSHSGLTEFTYEIPLSGLGSTMYIAAHTDVSNSGALKTNGAWAQGTPFVPNKGSWGTYFTYTIQACNEPPLAVDDTATVAEDSGATVIDVLANDSDPEGDPFTIDSASDPANGTVVVAADGLSLTYEPDPNYCNDGSPTDDFTYTLAPGGATATVEVTVACVDDIPVAVDDSATVAENSSATTINVLANDSDVEGDPFTIASASDPANGTVVVAGDGLSLTYQPDPGYCNGGSPTDDFTYSLSPGGSTATVTVTVGCQDDPPVAVNDAATVAENSGATTINVLANDTDADGGPIGIDSVTQPSNGTVVITNAGADLTYEPDADYCNDGTPTDDFTYTITPGGSTATVAVTVTCVDEAPVAVDDTATVAEDSGATTINVLANDTDADGGPISITSVTQPTNGAVVITNAGADLTYQPAANYCNDGSPTDDFTYTLTPGGSTATVEVTVTCADDPPTAFDDTATVAEDSTATMIDVLANDTDLDGGGASFTIASASDPANGTVVVAGDGLSLTYQPDSNYCNGGSPTDDFTYTLTPGGSTATVAVTVNCVNDGPVNTVPGTQNVNEDTDLFISGISIADVDAGASDIQVTFSVLNGVVTVNTTAASGVTAGQISGNGTGSVVVIAPLSAINTTLADTQGLKYRGNLNFNDTRGSEALTLATDDLGNTGAGGALSDTDIVNITVNAVNDAPSAIAKNYNAQANMKITGLTGLLTGATDPDTGDGGYSATFTVGTVSATTPAGGTISNLNNATGSFDFDPPPGATGNVTFTYTVCDSGNPGPSVCSAPATVTVSVAGPVIWFVNPAVAGPGDGRLSNPFNLLSAAADVDASGHRIFVYTGTATNGITLNSDEWLIGQGVTGAGFDTLFGITPPAGTIARPSIGGTRPTIQGNVAMATSDVVRGLNIQPASGTQGLSGSGATSLTVNEVSVTTVNAAAVNLSNSGGTINLTSVSANGGSNGIVLNNTTGTFTVAGTGGSCIEANPSGCSGGTIQNMTGADNSGTTPTGTGIALNNAEGVSFTRMYIHDVSNYGIRGTSVNGFTLDNSVVSGVNGTNVASPFNDSSLLFIGLTGTSSISNNAITGGFFRNIHIDNSSGTLNLTVNNNSIHHTGAAQGDDGLFIEADTAANMTLNVTNNTFAAHGGDHFNLSLLNSPTVDLNFTGNLWSGGHAIGLGQGLFILGATFNGTFTYDILNNGTVGSPLVGNNSGGAIHVNKGSGTGAFSGTISGNVIGNPAVNGSGSLNASGIDVEAHGAGGSHTTVISNNLVRQFHNDGILILAGEGSAALNATVTGNTVSNPDASIASLHGIHFNIGTLPTDNMTACLDVKNNTLTNAGADGTGGTPANGGVDLRIRQRQLTTVRLPGYAGANNDNAAVQNFLSVTNSNALTTIAASNTVAGGGGGYIGGAACAQP
jgi:VCBS repeat-containing protein